MGSKKGQLDGFDVRYQMGWACNAQVCCPSYQKNKKICCPSNVEVEVQFHSLGRFWVGLLRWQNQPTALIDVNWASTSGEQTTETSPPTSFCTSPLGKRCARTRLLPMRLPEFASSSRKPNGKGSKSTWLLSIGSNNPLARSDWSTCSKTTLQVVVTKSVKFSLRDPHIPVESTEQKSFLTPRSREALGSPNSEPRRAPEREERRRVFGSLQICRFWSAASLASG